MVYPLLRRVLFRLDPERVHNLALALLGLLDRLLPEGGTAPDQLPVEVAGVHFPNPVGLAAGFDKDGVATRAAAFLGFGSVEVGTITPRSQPGNPRPRLFRLPDHRGIINRMGFNSGGASLAAGNLSRRTRRVPVGVNVGPNRDTPAEGVVGSLLPALSLLGPWADYLVLNLSSPNTPGLRNLLGAGTLDETLEALRKRLPPAAAGKPLFLKVSPDMEDQGLRRVARTALDQGVAGLIATNTTIGRDLVPERWRDEAGGLSGAPLAGRSDHVLAVLHAELGGRLPLIGAGGIFGPEDAYRKLRAGASLVQLYTGFVYEGPLVARRIVSGVAALLARDGFRAVRDAVGSAAGGTAPAPADPVA
ncbi:MAG: quinone-dependent dihydroorotate dehydrogenase [Candidatus Riflebacteria bacterium]|nr:quinone-dependent dihydroorotate dehydrogenase [Candidatus Riflebacteria bacterium]